QPLPAQTAAAPVAGGEAQRFVHGARVPAQWWRLFESDALDRLVREAFAHNPTLAAAQATLRQAQQVLRSRTGLLYLPAVDGSLTVARQRPAIARFGLPDVRAGVFTLYNASVDVAYDVDAAGGLRREIESLEAQVDYQTYQLEAAYLTLAGNVVTSALAEASLRAQIQATREILQATENQLAIVERQLEIGAIARTD